MFEGNVKNVERAKNYSNCLKRSHEEPVLNEELKLPDFADPERIKSAQRFFRSNYNAIMFSMYLGLVAILAIPSILNVLVHTRKSSTVVTAYKRYMQTIYHTLTWFRSDLKPESEAWQSLESVKKFHSFASRSATSSNIGIISQRDMAITQFGFMGFAVLCRNEVGIQASRQEVEDFCHFWRVVGNLLGIKDEYNICCGESFDETIERLDVVRSEFLLDNLKNPPEDFEIMTKYIVKALWCFNPFDSYREIIFMVKRLMGLEGFYYLSAELPEGFERRNLQIYNETRTTRAFVWLSVMTRQFLFKVFVFRWLFNIMTWIGEFFIRYFPVLAMIKFGCREAYVKIN